jgi:predicted CoA-substrate-specific enzyme activase
MESRFFAGLDVGSSATKAVIIDGKRQVRGMACTQSGFDFEKASSDAFHSAIGHAEIEKRDIDAVVATGYGRHNVEFAHETRTEISCHARGAYYYFEEAVTVIDIGGQDNKVIELNRDGTRSSFKMNRKCAAGTGAFIEEMARRMAIPMDEMEDIARKSTRHLEIGSFCTVFSATEILALIRQGEKAEDIVKGVFRSVAKRISEMAAVRGRVVATGGVIAHNPIMIDLLTETMGTRVVSSPSPQYAGAMGAALYALDNKQER